MTSPAVRTPKQPGKIPTNSQGRSLQPLEVGQTPQHGVSQAVLLGPLPHVGPTNHGTTQEGEGLIKADSNNYFKIISPILCCCLGASCLAGTLDTLEGGDVEHCQLIQAVKLGLWVSKKVAHKPPAMIDQKSSALQHVVG